MSKYVSGTYVGNAQGHGGSVSAEVEFDSDRIKSVKLNLQGETKGIGQEAADKLVSEILDKQTSEIDAVSGASETSTAVKKAVRQAIVKASGDAVSSASVSARYKRGVYQATEKGYFSPITVEVEVSEDKIKSVKIVDQHETPQIINTVIGRLDQRIVDSQSVEVDAITGATVSSNAVNRAVSAALHKAGANDEMIDKPVKKSHEEITYEADVVVVGCGTSGSAAAAQAKDLGLKVAVMEKSARIGGSGAISSGILGIGSSMQKEKGLKYDVEGVYNDWMEMNHWMVPESGLLRRYLNLTGKTIDWLVDKGFEFGTITGFDNSETSDVHWTKEPAGNGAFGVAGAKYFGKLTSKVDQFFTETSAKELLTDKDGKVTGVVGERYDGAKIIIKAPVVIIATGGFAGNSEMQEKFYHGNSYRFFGLLQNKGDGINMVTKVGGQLENPTTACAHFFAPVRDVAGFDPDDTNIVYDLVITPSLLNVNRHGARFTDESNAEKGWLQSAQYRFKQGTYYTIVSQSQMDKLKNGGTRALGLDKPAVNIPFLGHATEPDEKLTNINEVMEAAVEQEIAYKGETLSELAQNSGMNEAIFAENVALYEQYCENGKDDSFDKSAKYLQALGDGPYYAIKTQAVPYNTMGGVAVNGNVEVVDKDYNPIPGLFAVGMDSMGAILDGVGYPNFGGPATSWCLNSGRIAASEASKYLKKLRS